jgi:shikimate kinase
VRQLVLTGLPGSGKSTVGRQLAQRLGWRFVDLDQRIVATTGRSIEAIFAEEAEERFRQLEALATAEVQGVDRLVLAPGGGWITRPETVALLRPPARMAFLRVSPRVAAQRLRASTEVRPLVAGPDLEGRLEALLRDRQAMYSAADLAVDAELIVEEVVTELEGWLVSGGWRS